MIVAVVAAVAARPQAGIDSLVPPLECHGIVPGLRILQLAQPSTHINPYRQSQVTAMALKRLICNSFQNAA